jgi:hypothetical protein
MMRNHKHPADQKKLASGMGGHAMERGKQQSPQPAQVEGEVERQKLIQKVVDRHKKLCRCAAGVGNEDLADFLVNQMSQLQIWCSEGPPHEQLVQAAVALREMNPRGMAEAMLAVQMFGVHNTALKFLKQATIAGQTFEGADACVLRATRLLRLFNEQLESMARLKGKTGQQKVTVEHVHVHSGGQAVVGLVESGKGGSSDEHD